MSKIASPKSAAWARSILTEREVVGLYTLVTQADVDALVAAIDAGEATQSDVSGVIDHARNAPRKVRQAPPADLPDVPPARYALVDDTGTVKFYKVDRPEKGRWEGFTFLNALASDTEYPIRNKDEKARILAAIAADVRGALARYGHEIGSCGVCGRTLTDEESRAKGIGPICEGRLSGV